MLSWTVSICKERLMRSLKYQIKFPSKRNKRSVKFDMNVKGRCSRGRRKRRRRRLKKKKRKKNKNYGDAGLTMPPVVSFVSSTLSFVFSFFFIFSILPPPPPPPPPSFLFSFLLMSFSLFCFFLFRPLGLFCFLSLPKYVAV